MSKGDTWENDFLKLTFNAVSITDICTTTGTANLTVALHTADPGEAGTQATSETAYTGYARVSRARSSGGFTVTGSTVTFVADVDFGECTASPGGNLTHFSIGTGTGNKLLYSGAFVTPITMAVGVIPRIKAVGTSVTED